MLVLRQDEYGDERLRRQAAEDRAVAAHILRMDTESVIDPVHDLALTQMANVARRIPLDYAAIIQGRSARPEFFKFLPDDAACRAALGIEQPQRMKKGG